MPRAGKSSKPAIAPEGRPGGTPPHLVVHQDTVAPSVGAPNEAGLAVRAAQGFIQNDVIIPSPSGGSNPNASRSSDSVASRVAFQHEHALHSSNQNQIQEKANQNQNHTQLLHGLAATPIVNAAPHHFGGAAAPSFGGAAAPSFGDAAPISVGGAAAPPSRQPDASANGLSGLGGHDARPLIPNPLSSNQARGHLRFTQAAAMLLVRLHNEENMDLQPLDAHSCAELIDQVRSTAASHFDCDPPSESLALSALEVSRHDHGASGWPTVPGALCCFVKRASVAAASFVQQIDHSLASGVSTTFHTPAATTAPNSGRFTSPTRQLQMRDMAGWAPRHSVPGDTNALQPGAAPALVTRHMPGWNEPVPVPPKVSALNQYTPGQREQLALQRQKQTRGELLESKRLLQGVFDLEERKAIRTAKTVGFEPRSTDTSPSLPKTAEGYNPDAFLTADSDSDLEISTDEDESASVYLPTDEESDESDTEPDVRLSVITKYRSKYPELTVSSFDIFPKIVLRRRCGRSRYIELILNSWMHLPLDVDDADVACLLKILKFVPSEVSEEVFSFIRFLRFRSNVLFRFIFRCIVEYLPHLRPCFEHVHRKHKSVAPAVLDASSVTEKKKPKPTTPKPTIQNIHDIVYVCTTFTNNYRRYEFDYVQSDYQHCSLFSCLNPDQQSTLARMSSISIADAEKLNTEQQLDLFRRLFGIKSSAECIGDLMALKFDGSVLDPADWSIYHVKFQDILNRTPTEVRPPESELAKRFVYACPMLMLRADVQAKRPQSLAAAFQLIVACLNNPGFLRSVAQKQNPKPALVRASYNAPNGKPLDNKQLGRPAQQSPRAGDIPEHHDRKLAGSAGRLPFSGPPPLRTPPPITTGGSNGRPRLPPCGRCRKTDHPEEACIAKHDIDNNRLPLLSDAVYASHKTLYFKLKEQAKAVVELDHDESPQTSEDDSWEPAVGDDYDDECAHVDTSFNFIVEHGPIADGDVPAPPLVGVALNPGPAAPAAVAAPPAAPPAVVVPPAPPLIGVEPNPGPFASVTAAEPPEPKTCIERVLSHVSKLPLLCKHGDFGIGTSNHVEDPSIPPAARLVGIELNPGPPPVVLCPQQRRPPRLVRQDVFSPRTLHDALAVPHLERTALPALFSDTSDDLNDNHMTAILPELDSPVTSDPDLHPIAASIHDIASIDLLPPPKFVGFLHPPLTTPGPPPDHAAIICAVDSMCLGEYSVISKEVVASLSLPTSSFSRTSRTATGALVKCSALAVFMLSAFINGQWHSFETKALVWDITSQPLLLCNSWALACGLIDMVQHNSVRCALFGSVCLCWRHWEALLQQHRDDVIDVYHIDVMAESDDDIVDLSAPLRVGDQDVTLLPPDAKVFALRYPIMTKALPFHAHPELDKWTAHVVTEDLAKYSWPACDLKDLKEDKFPLRAIPAIHAEFDKLIAQGFVEEVRECPTSVVMKAQLVSKSKTEKRFCVNGSQQKNVLRVGVFPMPSIKVIFAFVAAFKFRAKVDLKWGYYNFEIHPDDRKWTVTIGGGRAVQWRKLVQGFASSGAFFQFAMTKMLGPEIVGKIAQVYLDDLIIVGHTLEDCQRHVVIVMDRLNHFGFRVNFAKCQFTPSTSIDFLGCRLEGNVVGPGPKVSTMLERIKPFYLQPTPKGQRHHLHVFIGMCAYLLQHCPGLKQRLHPLYLAVAADPFRFDDVERAAFDDCRAMLCDLQVYHLPSEAPGYVMEIHTDSSGGAGTKHDPGHWGAVLGQRLNIANPTHCEGFELLQLAGGSFNERQAKWDILKKECAALYMAIKTFRPYTFGRCIRLIVDSKVLTFMHRSAVPMVQRWYAFIQSQDFVMIHFSSEKNSFADALTRCTFIPPAARLVGVEPNPGPVSPIVISSDTSASPIRSDDDAPIVSAVTRSASLLPLPPVPSPRPARSRRSKPPPAAAAAPAVPITPSAAAAAPLLRSAKLRATPLPKPDGVPVLVTTQPHRGADPAPALELEVGPTAPIVKKNPRRRAAVPPPSANVAPRPTPELHVEAVIEQRQGSALLLPAQLQRALDLDVGVLSSTPWTIMLPLPIIVDVAFTESTTAHVVCHPVQASASSMFEALSEAITHYNRTEAAAGRYFNDPCPSYLLADCRESVVDWMIANSSTTCPLLTMSPADYRRALYTDSLFGLYCNDILHQPPDWMTYILLLLDACTEPDELVLLCAACCFRCEIVIILRGERSRVVSPPEPFRRIFLTFDDTLRHFNWCHEDTHACNSPEDCADSISLLCLFSPSVLDVLIADRPHGLSDAQDVSDIRKKHIAAAHCGHTGHPGIQATIALLKSHGHSWRGMTAQVTQYVGRCATCILARTRLNPAQPAVSTLRLSSRPLRRWHCDQTGTMTPCKYTGFDRIITFICEATGFVILFGSRFGSALELTIALVHVVGLFGMFDSFHSDNGSENDNFIIHQFCKITGIKHTLSIPSNPESNGLVERGIQTVKRFLRTMIADGLTQHDSWGFFIPIVQKAVNSSPFGPLQVPPSSIVFASLYCPETFVIPSFSERRSRYDCEVDLADGNHYHPSSNFVHRASYFQHAVNNIRQDMMERAFSTSVASPDLQPAAIAVGSQVLIPWPSNRRPTSLHPYRRGPYIVLRSLGNVLFLQHAVVPVPDMQAPSLRWSSTSQVYLVDAAFQQLAIDPSAAHASSGIPFQRAIDCVLSYSLRNDFQVALIGDQRFHVTSQTYRCRLMGGASALDADNFVRQFSYDDISHTLAFDAFILCHPFLLGHRPVANMPTTWNPCIGPRSSHPMHVPDIAAERDMPLIDPEASDDSP